MKKWVEEMVGRKEFEETRPVMFDTKENVV